MFHSAAPSRDKESVVAVPTLWEQDSTLQPLLSPIVAEAAEAGHGARLVVLTSKGKPHVLIGVHGNRHPWRAPALVVLEHGDARSYAGIVAAPIYGPPGARGALLLYHDPARPLAGGEDIARAHAARIELALTMASARLAATHSAVNALHQALAAHDERTGRHAIAVRALTRIFGQAMRVPAHTLREWEWAALLHDVGKIAVLPSLLHKPCPLDADEWTMIRRHPSMGERIIRTIPALDAVGSTVRHHHERWDGGGYPDRLSGESIPLASRVICLVDAYETMRTGRPYRAPMEQDETLEELTRAAGSQFDPHLLTWLPALTRFDLAI
jgi:hypothetical protein